ncbi:MAG TPA: hypothetical protein VI259_05915 [Gemmatimonadaceae bacterium]|jgi:hypothetical protein
MSFDMMRAAFAAAVLTWASTVAATPFTGSVQLDTSLLANPFEIAFVLTDGSGTDDGNTTVTLDNFAFGGGSAGAVDATLTSGDVSGTLGSGFSMRDSSFIGIIAAAFTPGTALSFDFLVDWTPEVVDAPDLFAFVLLGIDGTPIATTDPSGADALMTIESGVTPTPLVRTYTGDLTPAPLVATNGVDEPGTISMLLVALIASVNARRRSRKEMP